MSIAFRKASLSRFLAIILLAGVAATGPAAAQPAPQGLPGSTRGTGTHFALPDSPYLPVTLDSSVAVTLSLSSVPEVVDLMIAADPAAGSALFTFGGFAANKLYYRYMDEGLNPVEFTTDATGGFTYIQDLSEPHHVWFRERPSTFYLYDDATGGDCSASLGTWSSATKTCTLTHNVNDAIFVQNNGITLDGAGYQVSAPGNWAIYSYSYSNITIKNLNVIGSSYGILVAYGTDLTITNNSVSGGYYGIYTYGGSNVSVTNNAVTNTIYYGIYVEHNGGAGNVNVAQNAVSGNNGNYGILIYKYYGSGAAFVTNNIISGAFYSGVYSYVYGSSLTINQNAISGASYGVQTYTDYQSNWTLTDNTISNSSNGGLYLYNYNNYNNYAAASVYHNNFINNATQIINSGSIANFNQPAPIGGNYFSDFNTPAQGCNDANADSFCDTAYVFSGGQDNLPWTAQERWLQVPVANPDAYSVNEDGSLSVNAPGVLGNDSDLQNESLTASLASGPANGTLSFNADGSFTYTPNPNFHGSDSFTYAVTDGTYSPIAKVTLTVTSVNDPPVVDLNGADESGIDFSAAFRAGDPPVWIGDADLTLTNAESGVVGQAVSGTGIIYVVNIDGRIISIDPTTGTQTPVSNGNLICSARMMAIDSTTQELFVADSCGSVVKVTIATGVETVVASGGYLNNGAWGIDLDPNGNIVVASYSTITRINRSTSAQTLVSTMSNGCAYGLAVEADGDILVTDPCDQRIWKIDPVSGAQTVLTNNIIYAYDIAIDLAGDLFVVEQGRNGQITHVDPTSGATTMIAPGSSLTNQCAYSIAADGAGQLITSNYCSGVVSKTEINTGAQASLTTVQYNPLGVAVDVGDGSQTIKWATVQITNLLDGASEVLSAVTTGTNISASYVAATGTLNLTGHDSAQNYQTVLRTVTYSNASASPSGSSRVIDVVVFDGTDQNNPVAKSTIMLNAPPSANAGGPYNGNEGSVIAMSGASASDPNAGDTLTYAWTVNSTLCSFDDANALNPNLTCTDNGSFTATLQVSDGTATDSGDAAVTVNNVAPTITGISMNATQTLTGTQVVTFTGSAPADPSAPDTTAGFAWQWSVDGGAYSAFGAVGVNTFTNTFLACGTHAVTARARDKDSGVSAPLTSSSVSAYEGHFLAPLNEGALNLVQRGKVIPVKISIGCGGVPLTGLAPAIQLLNGDQTAGDETSADEVETLSVSAADTTGSCDPPTRCTSTTCKFQVMRPSTHSTPSGFARLVRAVIYASS